MDRFMSFVVVVVAAVMIQCVAAQMKYVVGDSLGWAIPPNGAQAYITWASTKSFVIGDILIFNFKSNQHDVLQVSKDSYNNCSSANPIGTKITAAPANITLNSAGDHYYICTVGGHCQAGQKLHVTVSGTPGAAPPSTNTPTTPVPATPSPTSSTPNACAPTPSPAPTTDGPTASTVPGAVPPSPGSSSSAVFAGFFLTLFAIATGFFL